jgi:hypothetical protein
MHFAARRCSLHADPDAAKFVVSFRIKTTCLLAAPPRVVPSAQQPAFWSAPTHAERLRESILLDVTSLTNVGLIAGAFIAMRWRAAVAPQMGAMQWQSWAAIAVAGLVLGYTARIAFGCNVGAFFSDIATGSLHGWVWFAAAFAGSVLGIRLRPILLQPAARPPLIRADAR